VVFDPNVDYSWERLNFKLEVAYGSSKNLKAFPVQAHKDAIYKFISNNPDDDERYLANLWLQKFDEFELKHPQRDTSSKNRVKRNQKDIVPEGIDSGKASSKMKQSSKFKSSNEKNSPAVQSSVDLTFASSSKSPIVIDANNFSGNLQEKTNKSFRKLTPEMKAIWKKNFHLTLESLYAYDVDRGEQNRYLIKISVCDLANFLTICIIY
jgi:hypothetical protein